MLGGDQDFGAGEGELDSCACEFAGWRLLIRRLLASANDAELLGLGDDLIRVRVRNLDDQSRRLAALILREIRVDDLSAGALGGVLEVLCGGIDIR